MRLLLFADGQVGHEIANWLMENYSADLEMIVTTGSNEITLRARELSIPCCVYASDEQLCELLGHKPFDLGVLAWWPKIISGRIINLPSNGFINTHPSLLPYNRGKHYNFWALVEQAPFGVSLHFVDEGVDNGDLIAQSAISYDWEDSGKTLYEKACQQMVCLFRESYPSMRQLRFDRRKQNLEAGSFHKANELEAASRIDLERPYTARQLLNLMRARTFAGHPGCWFDDEGSTYEVRVQITRK
jgi:methionyl-tRNA formyltransferase